MKLSAGLLTCVAAGPTVTCNKGDAAVMTAKLLDADVKIDLTTVGWTKVTGGYEKEYVPTAGDVEEVVLYKDETNHSLGTYRALQFVNSVDSNGCETKTVGGVTVCVKTGHEYTFTCNYDLSDQDLTEQPFTVSGSDTVDSATNTGSLTYTLTVDKTAAYTIGDTITAAITPATSGLVYATITSCEVRNTSEKENVSLIGADLEPVTEVGTAVSIGSGTGALGFSWSSFKWSTSKTTGGADSPDEDQELHCSISLSREPKRTVEFIFTAASQARNAHSRGYVPRVIINGQTTSSRRFITFDEEMSTGPLEYKLGQKAGFRSLETDGVLLKSMKVKRCTAYVCTEDSLKDGDNVAEFWFDKEGNESGDCSCKGNGQRDGNGRYDYCYSHAEYDPQGLQLERMIPSC